MRKIVLLLIGCSVLLSCKNDTKTESETIKEETSTVNVAQETNASRQLKGEFIYYEDAAVLQTPTEVYGVVIDSMMHQLQEKVKGYKTEATDMVPVAVMGKVIPKDANEEGWPYKVQILQILKVYEPQPESNNVIKLEKQTK